MQRISKAALYITLSLLIMLIPEERPIQTLLSGNIATPAQAIIGRPATPLSVAGVARRTTRRQIRRTNRYIATLPPSCIIVHMYGTQLWQCGGVYYQRYNSQYMAVDIY